jgi:broad specificity phosphatase PhoE
MLSEKANETKLSNTIYLVRHGENLANLTKELSCRKVDYPLNSKGRLQARQTAAYIRDLGIDAVYASPLKRAMETAEIIARETGHQVVVKENFRELNVGDLEDMGNSPEGWRLHFRVLREWEAGKLDTRFPGGENYFIARDRMRAGIEQALAGKTGRKVVIVGHGGLFSASLHDLCPQADFASVIKQENHNCSVSEIVMHSVSGRWVGELVRWGEISHLRGEAADLVSGLPLQ